MGKKIGIIGTGSVGTAIGILLQRQGYMVAASYDVKADAMRSLVENTQCRMCTQPEQVAQAAEILFITTNDTHIQAIAEELAEQEAFAAGQIVIHMSGSQSSDIMAAAHYFGAMVLSVHPLQSFANSQVALTNLLGSVFSIEGDHEAYGTAVELVEALGGEYFFINRQNKALYHAGACAASNYLVSLMHLGVELLVNANVPKELAKKALLPLVRGTLHNLEQMPLPQALTGPVARGDAGTIENQVEQMEQYAPQLVRLYSELGLYTTDLAEEKGTSTYAVQQIREIFTSKVDMTAARRN